MPVNQISPITITLPAASLHQSIAEEKRFFFITRVMLRPVEHGKRLEKHEYVAVTQEPSYLTFHLLNSSFNIRSHQADKDK